jgi:type IV pilus biogenesis protein CpaD/CtpE
MHRRLKFVFLALAVALLAACASEPPAERRPLLDMAKIRKILNCPGSKTPACTQHVGRTTRCFCADNDALEEILDPYVIE